MAAGLTVVVDYGLCNIDSMARALEECGATSVEATRDPRVVSRADRIVLPGVGTFEAAMRNLKDWQLFDAILEASARAEVPFLGACLGMQLMATSGTEGGGKTTGLGFVDAEVVRLVPGDIGERIPHIGWNEVHATSPSILFQPEDAATDFYFVHSFHMKLANLAAEAGRTPYCGGFTAAIALPGRPIFGTQFHPEKSQEERLSAPQAIFVGLMLKARIVPTLLMKGVGLVKGVGFDSWRRVGAALQSIRVYNLREVDELILLDIAATANGARPNFREIDDLADNCFMPMTVGGGVRTVEDIRSLLAVGADKVAINSAAVATPELIREGSAEFGAQCIVVSIDVRRREDGSAEVVTGCGRETTGRDPVEWAKTVAGLGAGEILLTSVERDGAMVGYDVDMVRAVTAAVDVPVIASGGCGNYGHMADVLSATGASAVAAASIFHFTEQTPREAKRYLADRGFPVRI